jgi:exodeoxyribonuclease V alpha subunit
MNWYKLNEDKTDIIVDNSIQGITNGECGVILHIFKLNDDKDTVIIVKYEDRFTIYKNNFEELDHAWALTVHKSQGSQWRAIILPMARQYYRMLDNNLLYTAYTRAELFNAVIGEISAIKHAIKTHNSYKRYTGLKRRLLSVSET